MFFPDIDSSRKILTEKHRKMRRLSTLKGRDVIIDYWKERKEKGLDYQSTLDQYFKGCFFVA